VKHVLIGAAVSWCSASLLALVYAACTTGRISLDTLRLPGVLPVALLISTGLAILMTPLFVWAFRSGGSNGASYGFGLLLALLAYVVIVTPISPFFGLYGSIILGVAGLAHIGRMNP
jgi:hypothetical protein